MTALFELQIPNEDLSTDELVRITGCARQSDQLKWLASNNWMHHKNSRGEAMVGRFYARLKMAGINVESIAPKPIWKPDFASLNSKH